LSKGRGGSCATVTCWAANIHPLQYLDQSLEPERCAWCCVSLFFVPDDIGAVVRRMERIASWCALLSGGITPLHSLNPSSLGDSPGDAPHDRIRHLYRRHPQPQAAGTAACIPIPGPISPAWLVVPGRRRPALERTTSDPWSSAQGLPGKRTPQVQFPGFDLCARHKMWDRERLSRQASPTGGSETTASRGSGGELNGGT
jgi:hypothetical protein